MKLKDIISYQISECQIKDKYIVTILVENIEHFYVVCSEIENCLKTSKIKYYTYRITRDKYITEMYVSFDNNSILRVWIPSEYRRGWRTHCAIIDDSIPEKMRDEIIYPKIVNWQCDDCDQLQHRIILVTIME